MLQGSRFPSNPHKCFLIGFFVPAALFNHKTAVLNKKGNNVAKKNNDVAKVAQICLFLCLHFKKNGDISVLLLFFAAFTAKF